MLKVLDLFSGIGGFSLGLERTGGFKTIAFCEIDPFCRRVLAKHWPGVPIRNDIRRNKFTRIKADVIVGGFPCQDISAAGKGAGLAGKRSGLWRELLRAIRVVRPRYAVVENVARLLGRGMGTVLGDLAKVGYDAEWHCIPAAAVGAPHTRDRVWIVAYPNSEGVEGPRTMPRLEQIGSWGWDRKRDFEEIGRAPFEPRKDRWPQPILRGMDDGVSDFVDRHRSIGNAVVPQIPQIIGQAIADFERARLAEGTAPARPRGNHNRVRHERAELVA